MKILIFSHFLNFEMAYLAEKSIFFDETFFVASGYPSSTKLPIFTGVRSRRKNPHAIHFLDAPQPESQITSFIITGITFFWF